jgi:transcriptional regulator with XRE-family HTH domain
MKRKMFKGKAQKTGDPKMTKRLTQLKGKQTLRRFADKLGVGQSTLCNYLQGREMPARFIKKVVIKTGCDPAWLLGFKGNDSQINYNLLYEGLLNEVRAQRREMGEFLKGQGATNDKT